jgi:hypothetical protein
LSNNVIDDLIDIHPNEAYPRRQGPRDFLDLGAKKNGDELAAYR